MSTAIETAEQAQAQGVAETSMLSLLPVIQEISRLCIRDVNPATVGQGACITLESVFTENGWQPTIITGAKAIGEGSVIGAGAVLERDVEIGPYTRIQEGAHIDGGGTLGYRVTVGGYSEIGQNNTIKSRTSLGLRVRTGANVAIGEYNTIHDDVVMGSAVKTEDDVEIGPGAVLNNHAHVLDHSVVPAKKVIKASEIVVPRKAKVKHVPRRQYS